MIAKRTKRRRQRGLEAVNAWNEQHAPGTPVNLLKDDGEIVRTKTRSGAELLGGHTPVIWLEGIAGAWALDRVTAVE